jgi:hypothetical protein
MSFSQLVVGFETCIRRIIEERTRPSYIPLHVAICRPEGAGGSIFVEDLFGPLLGHSNYTPRSTVSTWPADCYALAFHTPRDSGFVPTDRVNGLISQAQGLATELQVLCARLPLPVRQVLCLPEINDWWRTVFHLAWHFDRPFLSSSRIRLLTSDNELIIRTDETIIQQYGCADRRDVFPGVIFGTLSHDVLTSSEAAATVILDALRGKLSTDSGPTRGEVAAVFTRLRDRFLQAAELTDQLPNGRDTHVKLIRFSDSFRTPPATEWAGLQFGGQVESLWQLAHINADQELCQVRGPATEQFTEWATEAGQALPLDALADATLFSEDRRLSSGFVTSVVGPTPVLTQGPVERWLRFVFSTLKRFQPNELEIQWGTPSGASSYGMATLKRNIFAASALAIELSNLLPADNTSPRTLAPVRFRDPLETDTYPPPGAGRYILFSRGDLANSGEPEWRPGWTWAERPEDGWVECGECDSDSGAVPVATGKPPTICKWLPTDWPARFFPLGSTAKHCAGWRQLVMSVLNSEHNTIPPDDPRYGWLTLTRATRQLAHHLGVIPVERVVAPLPASRDEARREAEPLLDGLVFTRGTPNTSPQDRPSSTVEETAATSQQTKADQPRSPTQMISSGSEVERLLDEARAGYSNPNLGFTLVALPCRSDADGRAQRCEDGSPDTGQIKDGVFYWPLRSFRHFGNATVNEHGSFVFLAFDDDGKATTTFFEFSGRAAAALLATAPRWASINRPGPAFTTWATALMFLSPSTQTHAVRQPSGPLILYNPWATSIAALRDILSPPSPVLPTATKASAHASQDVPTWEATPRRLVYRGQVCKQFTKPAPNQERILAAFQEEEWPTGIDDPLPAGKLSATVESLNDRLQHIRFRLNGDGTGVCWSPV